MDDRLKLAVFDCDGTLVDSQKSIVRAMRAAFEAHGFRPPADRSVRRVVGLPLETAIADLLPESEPDLCRTMAETYKRAFAEQRSAAVVHEPLYPGVTDALDRLQRAGVLLGVATGKSRRGLVNTLNTHGLADRFVTLQTADIGPGKPAPDMLLRAMAETGASPENTVMLGDTTYDIYMARDARVVALGVSWGYHEAAELLAAGAHRVLDAFSDVPRALNQVWEG